jgi:DNA repair exonuclease SbcCD nuclease subunit
LRALSGPVAAVLPGNHDYLGPGDDLWRHFSEASADAVLLLNESRPYPLASFGIDACLYPGPCLSIQSASNVVGWMKSAARDPAVRWHIGVAHGSLEGVSPDLKEKYYPMTRQELGSIGMDLWLLGHTHLPFPERPGRGDRIFIAGTPEPDDFKCRHGGSVWLLEIAAGGQVNAGLEATGQFRFLEESAEVRSLRDLGELERRLERLGRGTLLRQRLAGKLPREDFPELSAAKARLAAALTYLDWHDDGVEEEISEAVIDQEFPAGSFPHRMLKSLAASGDAEALQLAYEMLLEVRQ